jgi:predicted dehydrogenase
VTVAGKLKAGVVGVGSLGQHHARLYASMDGVELVGVYETDEERAREITSKHGGRPFDSLEALAKEVDLVSVASPTTTHEEATSLLIDASVATLVEKPIAASLEQAERLVERARSRGVPLMVGHIERFNPAVTALIQRAERPRFLEIHRLAPFVPRSLDVDVILDLMIHDLDLCRVLFDRQTLRWFDASGTPALSRKIDIASVRLRFEDGAAANLTASRISHEKVRRVRAFEPGRYLACDTIANTVSAYSLDESGAEPTIRSESFAPEPVEPLRAELQAFRDAVARGEEVPVSGEDGTAALRLALEIRDAIETPGAAG